MLGLIPYVWDQKGVRPNPHFGDETVIFEKAKKRVFVGTDGGTSDFRTCPWSF